MVPSPITDLHTLYTIIASLVLAACLHIDKHRFALASAHCFAQLIMTRVQLIHMSLILDLHAMVILYPTLLHV